MLQLSVVNHFCCERHRTEQELATAIPRITSEFHSIDNVGWYGAVYELSVTALQPTVVI